MVGSKEIDKILESRHRTRRSFVKVGGVGINDCIHPIAGIFNGKKISHRGYVAWSCMVHRCYWPKAQETRPTYIDCEICEEWLYSSNFISWWKQNHIEGWELDKDLLFDGNREYSPDKCIYIPSEINTFLLSSQACRGKYPVGVSKDNRYEAYRAALQVNGKQVTLATFNNPEEAHMLWYKEKKKLAYQYQEVCDKIHPNLFSGLLRNLSKMKENYVEDL